MSERDGSAIEADRRPPHPFGMIDDMTDRRDDDTPTADELDQLAPSLAMDGSLGRRDALRLAEVLRQVAAERRTD